MDSLKGKYRVAVTSECRDPEGLPTQATCTLRRSSWLRLSIQIMSAMT